MKKLILSLAVIAASGAYVVAEGHAGTQAATDVSPSVSLLAPALKPNAPVSIASPASLQSPSSGAGQPAASLTLASAPGRSLRSMPTSSSSLSAAASASPIRPAPLRVAATDVPETAPVQVPAAPRPTSDAVPPQPLPPLPRPRPISAAQPEFQLAQASQAGGPGQYADGTYRGSSADAYYGRVQVSAVVSGGHITTVNVLQYPNDRGRSRRINGEALPMLEQEVIAAQSARVDIVSGATLTSDAYIKSLSSALSKASGNNA